MSCRQINDFLWKAIKKKNKLKREKKLTFLEKYDNIEI